jgi:Abortive infection alpha
MSPAVEEAGLLLQDSVAFWRFKNQIRVLNKAKTYCEKNNISPKAIPPKLLSPLLDGAALEEDEILRDKWAILLSNMVDSEQNIQNHVFPYILGQISTNELLFLDRVRQDKKARLRALSEELDNFLTERPSIEKRLAKTIEELSTEIAKRREAEKSPWSPDIWELDKKKRTAEYEFRSLRFKESSILHKISEPETLPGQGLREFELSNVIRLGLVRFVQETYANSQTLEIPNDPHKEYLRVDLEVEVESSNNHILTELGELFIDACTEKKDL